MVTFPIVSLTDGQMADAAWFGDITDAVNDHENRISPGWTVYVPTWTASGGGAAIGNGTISGRHRRTSGTSDLVLCEIYLLAGSTTTFGSGFWAFTLPVGASASSQLTSTGTAYFYDTGTLTRCGNCRVNAVTTVVCDHPTLGVVTATVPHTWANTDILTIQIEYQPV